MWSRFIISVMAFSPILIKLDLEFLCRESVEEKEVFEALDLVEDFLESINLIEPGPERVDIVEWYEIVPLEYEVVVSDAKSKMQDVSFAVKLV